jgi:putative ABC transport system substrate-binding protein
MARIEGRLVAWLVTVMMGTAIGAIAAAIAAPKQARVSVLIHGAATTTAPANFEPFIRGLHDHGWVEGKNLMLDVRFSDGELDVLERIAAETVSTKPDVIVVPVPPTAHVVKRLTRTIPIVMVGTPAPVETGLIASLPRPASNVTGVAFDPTPEMFGKLLELLLEAVPKASRVAALRGPDLPGREPYLRVLDNTARTMKLSLEYHQLRSSAELDATLAAIRASRPHALLVTPGPLAYQHRQQIADFALVNRLPTVSAFTQSVDVGGLLSYGPALGELSRRSAWYVDRILRGASAAELPVEQPTKFETGVNLKTARALGLVVPQSLLLRADRLIQ